MNYAIPALPGYERLLLIPGKGEDYDVERDPIVGWIVEDALVWPVTANGIYDGMCAWAVLYPNGHVVTQIDRYGSIALWVDAAVKEHRKRRA